MAEHIADNNKVVIVGKVNGPMEFSHEIFGENFFNLTYRYLVSVIMLIYYPSLSPNDYLAELSCWMEWK